MEDVSKLLHVENDANEKIKKHKFKKNLDDISVRVTIHHICNMCKSYGFNWHNSASVVKIVWFPTFLPKLLLMGGDTSRTFKKSKIFFLLKSIEKLFKNIIPKFYW